MAAWLSSANSLSKAVHSEGTDLEAVVEEIDKFLDVLTLRSGTGKSPTERIPGHFAR